MVSPLLPPVFVVFPALLLGFASGISLSCRKMHCHKVKTSVQAGLQSVRSTFFTVFLRIPARKH